MTCRRIKARDFAAILVLLLCALMLVGLWYTGRGYCDWVWSDLVADGSLKGFREGNKTFSLEKGDTYGVLNRGPGFSLPAGEYRLTWSIETDADNLIRIETSNAARVTPSEIVIPANSWGMSQSFVLLDDAENVEIRISFEQGNYLKIHNLGMSTRCTDHLWLLTMMLMIISVLYALNWCGWLTTDRKRVLLVLGITVLVASVPAFRENLNAGHDSEFHRMRLRNVVSGLSQGQFPVRVGGYMYNGYGGAASIFYPDDCLYLPALLMLGGATIQFALSAMFVAINAVTAATAYACGKRMSGHRAGGLCAAVLYTLASYRLTDLYTRMALGEAAAMAVIPLFLLGLWEVVFGEKRRWPLLVIGATAVFHTHMISTVLCALLAVCICAASLVRMIREKRLLALAGAAVVTVLLNLSILVPLLDYMMGGISMGTLNSSVSAAALGLPELFARNADFPRDIGMGLLLCAAATAYVFAGRKEKEAGAARVLLLLGTAMALMATKLFPWALVEKRLGAVVNFLQFPWRLLMFADIFFALACGYGVTLLSQKKGVRDAAVLGVLAVSVMASSAQIEQYAIVDQNDDRYWLSNSEMITAYGEYTLPGSDLARTVTEHGALLSGDVQLTAYEKTGTEITAEVSSADGGAIEFPLFAFDGYKAELDGHEIAIARGDNNRIHVEIPTGTNGLLQIWFAGKPLWRVADAVSLAMAAALCAYVIGKRKMNLIDE